MVSKTCLSSAAPLTHHVTCYLLPQQILKCVGSNTKHKTISKILPNIQPPASFLILGAGVIGLTTALELRSRHPTAKITIAAKYLPGDSAPEYTSAWGGANWFPASRDNGRQQDWDTITYRKFRQISTESPESGIEAMRIRFHYEKPIEEVGILTPATGKLWFEELVGGLEAIEEGELPEGTVFGFEMASFVINVQMYLPWFVLLRFSECFGSILAHLLMTGYKLSAQSSVSRSIATFSNISMKLWSSIPRRPPCSIALGWER